MAGPGGVVRTLLHAPVAGRTWREVAYQVLALLLAPLGLLVVVLLLLGVVLSVTFLGLPVIALALTCARGLTGVHRRLVRNVLRVPVGDPAPRPRGRNPFDALVRTLTDATAWGATGYLLLQAPLAVLAAAAPVFLGATFAEAVFGQETPRAPGVVLLALVVVLGAPWVLHGCVRFESLLLRTVAAGPGADTERLRRSRSAVLEGSAAEVRAIERNLHDGTQARLTAIALHVDLARSQLAGDPAQARGLLDVAHATTREAITELRTIIRGIHPPALDEGLDAALRSLAEQAGFPVHVDVDLGSTRPSPAIETMAYFCVAELLANVTKHAGAQNAWLTVSTRRRTLVLQVRDDGEGGADPLRGSGLRGLAQRVAGVDGTVVLDSPPGAGTRVRLELPVTA